MTCLIFILNVLSCFCDIVARESVTRDVTHKRTFFLFICRVKDSVFCSVVVYVRLTSVIFM